MGRDPVISAETGIAKDPASGRKMFFDYRAVFWATVFGGPLGGCVVMGLNFKQLRDDKSGAITLAAGFLATPYNNIFVTVGNCARDGWLVQSACYAH